MTDDRERRQTATKGGASGRTAVNRCEQRTWAMSPPCIDVSITESIAWGPACCQGVRREALSFFLYMNIYKYI